MTGPSRTGPNGGGSSHDSGWEARPPPPSLGSVRGSRLRARVSPRPHVQRGGTRAPSPARVRGGSLFRAQRRRGARGRGLRAERAGGPPPPPRRNGRHQPAAAAKNAPPALGAAEPLRGRRKRRREQRGCPVSAVPFSAEAAASSSSSAAAMESFLGGCRAVLQVAKGPPFCSRNLRCFPPLEIVFRPWSNFRAAGTPLSEHVQNNQEVHVVMGNEACDLDSTVSALVLAYFLAKMSPESKATFLPVLNIPRADFPLRTESTFLLQQHHIPESSLVFRDEIDLHALHRAGLLSLTLVDHHVLSSRDAALEEAVVEVIDHRPLEKERDPACRVTLEQVGSCATLVAEKILQGPEQFLDRPTAALLHATIVLDCVNMEPAAGKATPKDARIASLLESKFPDLPPRSTIFETLQKAKFDVSGLTTEQVLRKDLKAVSGKAGVVVALSTVYMNLQAFLRRPNLEEDLRMFCRQRGYDTLLAMTISFNQRNEPARQLAVYGPCVELQTAVCQALEQSSSPLLSLSPLESPSTAIRAYDQGNATASRKQVLPVVKSLLRRWDQSHPAMQPEGHAPCQKARSELESSSPHGARNRECDSTGKKDPATLHHQGDDAADEDTPMPPTPMNSLVDGCPLDRGLPKLSAEAVFERFNSMAMARCSAEEGADKK